MGQILHPKSERFDHRTIMVCLKSERVRISDVGCTCLRRHFFDSYTLYVFFQVHHAFFISGRGSIAWEHPQIRSTMCPMPDNSSTTILEEDEEEVSNPEMSAVANVADETANDQRYDGLINIIEDLKNQVRFDFIFYSEHPISGLLQISNRSSDPFC